MNRNKGHDTATAPRPRAMDWQAIHRRLEAARAAVEHGEALSPQQTKALLRTRARELARATEAEQDRGATIEVVEFVLAHETYAVESQYLREVCPLSNLTPVPGMPPHVLGIVNVRGQILFVIDIKKFFGLPEKGIGDLHRIVILQSQDSEFGVLADRVVGIRQRALDELQPSLPTLTGVRDDYLKGVCADRVVVLDAARLLSDSNILAQD